MRSILIFSDWYLPAYKAGGPIRSISNFIQQLQHSYDIHVVSSNRDFGDSEQFPSIKPNTWHRREQHSVIYLDEKHQRFSFYSNLIQEVAPDWLYFNSLYSVRFTIIPLLAYRFSRNKGKVLLAPRGMLGAGALQIKSTKKQIFIKLAEVAGLFRNITWHATSGFEKQEILKHFPDSEVFVALNFPDAASFPGYQAKKKEVSILKMFFLSRINIKKNLHYALKIIQSLSDGVQLQFDIYGPVEDQDYWHTCQEIMNSLEQKPDVEVNYKGEIKNEELFQQINQYHIFLLPTLNENYGHAIVEAFKNASPVIISDQTPWKDLKIKKAGFDIALSEPAQYTQAISFFAAMDQTEFNQWSEGAYRMAKAIHEDPGTLHAYQQLFDSKN